MTFVYSLTLARFALVGFLAFCCALFVDFDVHLLLSRCLFFFFFRDPNPNGERERQDGPLVVIGCFDFFMFVSRWFVSSRLCIPY